ncbi:PREDICTED: uncharacterized protein LOC104589636 isoform X2 [Nelumbo nucifera]|uniref:Uncharacterized protein LOC104589636 isoform X2 n=1 Tax=Nelumbo nucifera TaxID=4432 RepID=A0A1U7Z2I7_NELNU|nr:PREDICTED: uncharacterized protein LOC104589636 isoform X2 [Nelumbo nucifera]
MLLKRLACLSFSSSAASRILKIGDVLKHSRKFSDLDVLEYSKLSHDSNPLHFDSKCAKTAGFEDRLVHGMLVAGLFPQIIASHFIILSQEKNIQRLNELVRSLREQLLQCRGNNDTINNSLTPLTENVNELERQHILED